MRSITKTPTDRYAVCGPLASVPLGPAVQLDVLCVWDSLPASHSAALIPDFKIELTVPVCSCVYLKFIFVFIYVYVCACVWICTPEFRCHGSQKRVLDPWSWS